MEAQFRFSGCDIPAFSCWFSTTFLRIVIDVMTSGLSQFCMLWLGLMDTLVVSSQKDMYWEKKDKFVERCEDQEAI